MAAVYAVTHRNGVHAALKILHPSLCTDPAVCERFLGEGYVTNRVKHAGIVRVLDDGMTDDGCVFLVMDLLEGRTLEALRQERGGRIDVDETLDIADKLMDSLHAVHEAGIIHRDLKPQNVFICDDGTVKLLDFGVARLLENTSAKSKSLFGMVLGTPSFMSPEQATGARNQVDQRADVWSLGATIFTALTGETVHLGPHVQARLLAAGTAQARSIAIVKQDLPPAIAAVIDTALRFEKADRWQSVDAFRRALRDARHARASLPPMSIDNGPKRTFIGLGEEPVAFPPARNTLPFGTRARPGVAATLPMMIEHVPEAAEDHSYPAVHTPLPEIDPLLEQLVSRRSSAGFWVASAALVAAAIGTVAFLANGSAADEPERPAAAVQLTPATSMPAPSIPLPEPEPLVKDAPDASVVSHPPAQRTAIAPPPTWHPRHQNASLPSSIPTSSPIPSNTEPPAATPAPSQATDPFSTPE
jgi:serine/threonine-protein kinase